MRLLITVATLGLALGGCTTQVAVTKVLPGKPETHVGTPHPLMYSRYDITLRWQVSKCGETLKLKLGAEFKEPEAVPDPDNSFVIDPASLSSPLKTSQVLVNYHESGAPASLNATLEDHSVQTIANVASIGAGWATFNALPRPAGSVVDDVCSPAVLDALRSLSAAKDELDAASELVDARTSDLKAVTDKIADMGSNVDEATKSAFSKAISALGRAKATLESAQQAHGKLLEVISHKESQLWPVSGNQVDGSYQLPDHVFDRWTSNRINSNGAVADRTIFIELRGRDNAGHSPEKEGDVDTKLGIPIRQGAAGRVSACSAKPCSTGGIPVASRNDHVLQLGSVYYLPCISRPFSSVTCSYSTHTNGRLKSAGSAITNAPAEEITGALNDVISKAIVARQTRREAATKQLQAETAYLTAKAERDAAEAALYETDLLKADKDAAAAFMAQADRLNAERALIEANNALDAARATAQ